MSSFDTIQYLALHGATAPPFTFAGQGMWARVISVYDGDTMTCALPIFGSVYKFPMRISGMDTPEMKSKLHLNKVAAIRARNRLLQLIGVPIGLEDDWKKKDIEATLSKTNYVVWLMCGEQEKFGRTLCTVYKDPLEQNTGVPSFAQILINEKLAYAYGGGTKLTEEEQLNRAYGSFE